MKKDKTQVIYESETPLEVLANTWFALSKGDCLTGFESGPHRRNQSCSQESVL